jgi:uroporphyrin-III C-methyltransferase
MKNKLILIGAGPGATDLITLRAIERLQKAKVILYDALVNEKLLDFAPQDALKIYVGKRGGKPSFTQEKINQLIVSYALVYGEVIRLKGGDPFIFGRGLEEIFFAKKHGIEAEVIPGISSATGLTALNQISLTHRGVADGFWVLTASKKGK